ncbi:putative polygalacturonase-like [Capsicum annuum]|nr:putative polygalacturonase-like [Capsicum annuum]
MFLGSQLPTKDFKKDLVNDVHGMLNLYEEAPFRVHDEEILDEALTFTITQLKLILPNLSNSYLTQQSVVERIGNDVRDRLVELYFWSLGVYFEPQYSVARKILRRISYFLSIIDDTHDIYGMLDELTLLIEAIERWNIDASEQLPLYMKIVYCNLLDVYNEIEKELANENKSFLVNYSIIAMKKKVRAYFQEAKWYHEKKLLEKISQAHSRTKY